MQKAQAALLPDGRLHLHHGPIDLIIDAAGPGREQALQRAVNTFEHLLDSLVGNLSALRRQNVGAEDVNDLVAKRMVLATAPFSETFVTPMAAVAGAVAEEVLGALCQGPGITRAYVNNGGDIAIYLTEGAQFDAAVEGAGHARILITSDMEIGGLATSGWGGRSHSLGIADSVTVLARSAAVADVAATLIANAVDLPELTSIERRTAEELSPDSDLGTRLVTVAVPLLDANQRAEALRRGLETAQDYLDCSLIRAAYLVLQGETREISAPMALPAITETKDA